MHYRCALLSVLLLILANYLWWVGYHEIQSGFVGSIASIESLSTAFNSWDGKETSAIVPKIGEKSNTSQSTETFYSKKERFKPREGDSQNQTNVDANEERIKENTTLANGDLNERKEFNNSDFNEQRNKTSRYYMTITCPGRLGNQMFKYAALFGITRKYRAWTPFLGKNNCLVLHRVFGHSLSIRTLNLSTDSFGNIGSSINADETVERLNNLPRKNIVLGGYFQSHKYFEVAKSDLRKEFTFTSEVEHNVKSYFNDIVPEKWQNTTFVRVGIHVRRTDMSTEERQKMGYISPPPSYYSNAMEYFIKKYECVQFIVASDDLGWCKEYIRGDNVYYSSRDYVADLAILASCDHIITSIGTYSWWAGWLCKGTTIYYGKPPPANSTFDIMCSNSSWIPFSDEYNNWIPMA